MEFDILRREFLRLSLATTAVLVAGVACHTQPQSRPNIIFMLADDLGYGDIGCYGQQEIRTPGIDRLAREGTRFTQCYSGSPVCAPSRCVLMTGLHGGHSRIRANAGLVGGIGPEQRVPLELEDLTVAEYLREAGYVTGIAGKWGLGEPNSTGAPNRQGFDEWLGYLNQNRSDHYYTPYLWRNQEKFPLKGNQDGQREEYSHDVITEFALDFIRQNQSAPFFLYLPWTIPHQKYEVPSLGSYADQPWDEVTKIYAAMISRMDRDVGRVIDLLEELNISDQTIVFFSSDNGATQQWKESRFQSCQQFRGHKGTLYEGGIRVPMIVRWPGRVPAGRVDETVWYFADFLPTALALAGVPLPAEIDGVSLLPTLSGDPQRLDGRFLYWELHSDPSFSKPIAQPGQAVRFGDWKAIRFWGHSSIELYHLAEDSREEVNVASEYPEIVERIEDYLDTARTPSRNWPLELETEEVKGSGTDLR